MGRLESRLATHFAACGAACLTAAAVADQPSRAAIVHWSNINLVIPATIDGRYINVETRADASAGSLVAGWDINPYSATSLTWFNATGTGMLRFPGVTTGSAGNLAAGTVVGATGSYGSGAVTVGAAAGNWVLNSVNTFGFRFVAADGLTHYAYGKMSVGAAITTRTLTDIYYEDVAATSITIDGAAPPPGVPGPLPLLGAASAFAWSRRLRRRLGTSSSSGSPITLSGRSCDGAPSAVQRSKTLGPATS